LAFLHRFEQRGLDLGRRPVDFVGEDEIVENRPQLRFEPEFLGMIDHGAYQVGGQQIRGELEPRERGMERAGKRLDRQGFG